ncbi:DUF5681 domain-containing protein [Polynucleobacter sp. AP-Nino-20-G2]|uniref:DUF5681 domain-containing protein n=1 Tax=Polynucleobacter sp. AP-Nino-20-G2 TaxID=2576917 RepID=UPI001BFDA15A|nr:DUF5681 domain-containing protein [Polynucleobacter sp. AP-Nino-20-G2]QWE17157.1 hypothetical protein FD960_02750 [Polynucleobacter sp. AP-Nino-20-G2]
MSNGDYNVGYRRPPKTTQFKKGESGNPKGRPKGSRSLQTILVEELKSSVTIHENGRSKTVKKGEVIAKQMVNKAMAGDHKAAHLVLGVSQQQEYQDALKESTAIDTVAQEDQVVMQSIMERMKNQLLRSSDAATKEGDAS